MGAAVGREPFTDVSFVDDFAVLVEMLSVLRLMLTVVDQEAQVSWSLVNWAKTKTQAADAFLLDTLMPVAGDYVVVVESYWLEPSSGTLLSHMASDNRVRSYTS